MSNEIEVGGATHMDAPITDGRTEDQMLADILRGSSIVAEASGESLPEASDVPTPEQNHVDDDRSVQPEAEVVAEPSVEDTTDEDDTSTQEADVYNVDELDNFKVNIKIDGEEVPVSLDELVKGYATNQSLSNKGRELGDARKQLEAERQEKLGQIDGVVGAAAQILEQAEHKAAEEYHSYTKEIEEARADGDTYRLTELKDKQEVAQKKYWAAKNEKDQMMNVAQSQKADLEQAEWNQKLQYFQENIGTAIPDWSPEIAGEIRQFALDRGVPESVINTMVDVNTIKFVDDFRRAEAARSQGAVKREKAPTKVTPVRKGQTPQERSAAQNQELSSKVLSGSGTAAENDAFLKSMVSKHFE